MHTYNTHNIINTMPIQHNTTQYSKHNTGYTYGKHNTIDEKHNTTKNYAGLIHTAEYTGNSAKQYKTYIAHCAGNSGCMNCNT